MALKAFFKKDLNSLKENLLFAITFAIFYGIEAFFLNEEAFTGYGQYRPLVFLPALAAIVFGPLVGAFVGGFGNLTNDIIKKMIVQHKPLHIGHLFGFLGNFIGAYVVGVLSIDVDVKSKGLFSKESFKGYVWDSIAGSIGMGGVTGFIIAFGELAVGKITTIENALIFSGTITFWNSVFMTLLLPMLPLYGYLEKIHLEKKKRKAKELTEIQIAKLEKEAFANLIGGRFIDSLPLEKEWAEMGIKVKNKTNDTMRFRVEIIGPDIIQPSTMYTKKIPPGEIDEVTFSIYPLDKGERHFKVRIVPRSENINKAREIAKKKKDAEFELTYKAEPEESEKLSSLTSIIGLLVIFALLAKTFYEIISAGTISAGLAISLSLFAAEIALIILWYIWRKMQTKG